MAAALCGDPRAEIIELASDAGTPTRAGTRPVRS